MSQSHDDIIIIIIVVVVIVQTPSPESASELYRPRDRRL
jgi:hypothetical protein